MSQEAKAAVIYAKLIWEVSVSIRSSSPRDRRGLPAACQSLLRERRSGKQLLKAEQLLLPELHWDFNSNCESDLLSVYHLTNITQRGIHIIWFSIYHGQNMREGGGRKSVSAASTSFCRKARCTKQKQNENPKDI